MGFGVAFLWVLGSFSLGSGVTVPVMLGGWRVGVCRFGGLLSIFDFIPFETFFVVLRCWGFVRDFR